MPTPTKPAHPQQAPTHTLRRSIAAAAALILAATITLPIAAGADDSTTSEQRGPTSGTARFGVVGATPSVDEMNRYNPKVEISVAATNPAAQLLEANLKGTGYRIVDTRHGPMNCPVAGDHHFISSWGFARDGGKRRHKGNDIFAKRGTPVVAAGDGVIESLQRYDRRGSLGGIWIKQRLDSGARIYYAHLAEITEGLDVGDRVTIGQQIGGVGDTGNAKGTDPHLHIEIKPAGQPTKDPYPVLSQICDGAR